MKKPLSNKEAEPIENEVTKVGRKKREPCKTVGFRIPLRLIDLIAANAERKTGGNQSVFITRVLEGTEKLEEILTEK